MIYPSIRIEGAILSPDILDRLDDAAGQRPTDFGLDTGTKVKDEIARAWADAQDYWRIFQRKLEALRPESPATTETRQQWVTPLLGLLGYQLDYQAKGVELNGKTYAISHRLAHRGNTPIHIIGAREAAGLDKKPERTYIGAPRMSAHALVQEYLNLHDELYGIVSNGRILRLLRDSSRLIKLSYLEFDLDRMFGDGLFADFAILYRLLHVSRLPQTVDASSICWLERYHQDSIEQGSRIREGLRIAVTEALEILGTGFLSHPNNDVLREQTTSGELKADVYFNHLLRLVYRLLFLMVIEERGLVFPKGTHSRFINLYTQHYSVQRLRRLAVTRGLKVERFHDAWDALQATFQIFERPDKAAIIGTTALGGQLFHPQSLGLLSACTLSNAALFNAIDRLCNFDDLKTRSRTPVNFGALDTEEFGSVYESLLELHPLLESTPAPHFRFKQAAGNERKTSGSYYTPASLVDCLLDSALDPLLNERLRNFAAMGYPSADAAVLALKVCDPACGSGHFLIAAAQRIARRLAMLRAGGEEPGMELRRHTLREVIGHCIFGVDINPMSVELCKLGLWLEAVEPGKPLTFLDHHIKCGNSLLGATPKAIEDGIPDDAYKPIAGDTKEAATWMKKLNQAARAGQDSFDFSRAEPWDRLGNLPAALAQLETLADDTSEAVVEKEKIYREIVEGSGYDNARLLHDAWCAAFVWPKSSIDTGAALTTEHLRTIERNPHSVAPRLKETVRQLARQYRFFHWHLEFPAVFGADGNGGFDCVLGNPPWEMMSAGHGQEAEEEFARLQHCFKSNQYAILNGRRDLYKLFLVTTPELLGMNGIGSFLTPFGIFVEDDSSAFRHRLFGYYNVIELKHFQNGGKSFFAHVHASYRFCGVTFARGNNHSHSFTTVVHSPDELHNQAAVVVPYDSLRTVLGEDFAATIYDDFQYARVHQAVGEKLRAYQPFEFRVVAEFHSSTDKALISEQTRNESDWVVLKNRNIHQFNINFSEPEAWVSVRDVAVRLQRKDLDSSLWTKIYPRLVFRDIARNDDERTLIACLAPPGFVSTYDTPMVVPTMEEESLSIALAFYGAAFNAFLFDFLLRPFVDKHVKGYTLNRVPWPSVDSNKSLVTQTSWIIQRVLELSYTTWDLEPFARDCGFDSPPFRWDDARRFQLRCELDAAFFHVYGIERCDVAYIMDTFPIVKRKDEAQHGTYRTKDTILTLYDAIGEAQRTGQPFVSPLAPPPADPSCCHPPRTIAIRSLALADLARLSDAEWAKPGTEQGNDEAVVLAAALKALGAPAPVREVRLMALLAMKPRLLTPSLVAGDAALWRRLIGAEAEPLAAGIAQLQPPADHAWGNAVRELRGRGRLVENLATQTWEPGHGLDAIYTEGWPDGRVGMILSLLRQRDADDFVQKLPETIREWVNAKAA